MVFRSWFFLFVFFQLHELSYAKKSLDLSAINDIQITKNERLSDNARKACVMALKHGQALKDFFDFHEKNQLKIEEEKEKLLKAHIDFMQSKRLWPLPKNKNEANAILIAHKEELEKFQSIISEMTSKYKEPWYKRLFSSKKKKSPENSILDCSPEEFEFASPTNNLSLFEDWKLIKNSSEASWLGQEASDDQIVQTDEQCLWILINHEVILKKQEKELSKEAVKEPLLDKKEGEIKRNVKFLATSASPKKSNSISTNEKEKNNEKDNSKGIKKEDKGLDKNKDKKDKVDQKSGLGKIEASSDKGPNAGSLTQEDILKLKSMGDISESLKNAQIKKENPIPPKEEKPKLPSPPTQEEWYESTFKSLKDSLSNSQKAPEDYVFARSHLDKGAMDLKLSPEAYKELLNKWDDVNYFASGDEAKRDNFQSVLKHLHDNYLNKDGKSTSLAEIILNGKGDEKSKAEMVLAAITDGIKSKKLKLPENTSIGIQRYPGGEIRPVMWKKDTKEVFDLISGEKQVNAKVDVEHPASLTVDLLNTKEARDLLPDEKRILLKAEKRVAEVPKAAPAPVVTNTPTRAPDKKATSNTESEKDDSGPGFDFEFLKFLSNIGSFLKELPDLLAKFAGRVTMKDIISGIREAFKNPEMAKIMLEALKDEKTKQNLLDQIGQIRPEDITPEMKEKVLAKLKENRHTKGKEKLYEKMIEALEGEYGTDILRQAASMNEIEGLDVASVSGQVESVYLILSKYSESTNRIYSNFHCSPFKTYDCFTPSNKKETKRVSAWLSSSDGKKALKMLSPLMQAEIKRRFKEEDFEDLKGSPMFARGKVPEKKVELDLLKNSGLAFSESSRGSASPGTTPEIPELRTDEQGLPVWGFYEYPGMSNFWEGTDITKLSYKESQSTMFFVKSEDAEKFNLLRTDFEKAHFLFNLASEQEERQVKEESSKVLKILDDPERLPELSSAEIEGLTSDVDLKSLLLSKSVRRINRYQNKIFSNFPPDFKWEEMPDIRGTTRDIGKRIDQKSEKLNKRWAENPDEFIQMVNKMNLSSAQTVIQLAGVISHRKKGEDQFPSKTSLLDPFKGKIGEFSSEASAHLKTQVESGAYMPNINMIGLTGKELIEEKKKVDEVKGAPKIVFKWIGKDAQELAGKQKQDAIDQIDPVTAQKRQEAMKSIFGDSSGVSYVTEDSSKAKYKIHPVKWIELNKAGFAEFPMSDQVIKWAVENKAIKEISLKQLYYATSDQMIPVKLMDTYTKKSAEITMSKNALYATWLKLNVCGEKSMMGVVPLDLEGIARQNNWDEKTHAVLCP